MERFGRAMNNLHYTNPVGMVMRCTVSLFSACEASCPLFLRGWHNEWLRGVGALGRGFISLMFEGLVGG